MHGVPSIVCTMYNDNRQQRHVYCVCSSCFFYIKAVSTRLLTSKGIMYIKARNMVRLFNVKSTAIQSTIENQSAAYHAHSAIYGAEIPPSMVRNFRTICAFPQHIVRFPQVIVRFRTQLCGNSARSNVKTGIYMELTKVSRLRKDGISHFLRPAVNLPQQI